jgi:hypothetical protein
MQVQRVLARDKDGSLLVTWKGVAFIHASWISPGEVTPWPKVPGDDGVPEISRESDDERWDGCSPFVRQTFPEMLVPERVLAREKRPSLPEDDPLFYLPPAMHAFYLNASAAGPPGEAILVSWQGQDEPTWEWADDITFPTVPNAASTTYTEGLCSAWIRREVIESGVGIDFPGVGMRSAFIHALSGPVLILTDSIREWDRLLQASGVHRDSIYVHTGRASLRFLEEGKTAYLVKPRAWNTDHSLCRRISRPCAIAVDGSIAIRTSAPLVRDVPVCRFLGKEHQDPSRLFSEASVLSERVEFIRWELVVNRKPAKADARRWLEEIRAILERIPNCPVAMSVHTTLNEALFGKDPSQRPARNPYRVLGIPCGAGKAVAKRALHKITLRTHPDKCPGRESEFQEAIEAYQSICRLT